MRYLVLVFLFSVSAAMALPADSLIQLSDISFAGESEKNAFLSFQSKGAGADMIDLFLTPFSKEEVSNKKIHDEITKYVALLKKDTEGQSDEKKVRTIYKQIHKKFFKVYKLKNSFSDVFEKGEYNCVSGTALYAIVFGMMNIPYQIVEAPNHVFLIAYPESLKILIETTSPENGYFVFSQSYVNKYLKYLNKSKLISDEEYNSNAPEELFKKYYFNKNGLSLLELASVQYCNFAVYHTDENNNEPAVNEMKKACYLWRCERHKYFLESLLSNAVSNCDYKKEEHVKKLGLLCRFNSIDKKETSDEKIKYEFGRLIQIQLIENSDFNQLKSSFEMLARDIKDTLLLNEVAFDYHYEMARIGYNNNKNKDFEIPHLKGAYRVKPNHADLQSMIRSYFGKVAEQNKDPESILRELDVFSGQFDFVSKNSTFNSLKANCLLEIAYQSFVLNEIKKGESHLADFENLHKSNESVQPLEHYVEKAYSTAAGYYYKKGNVARTRELLKKGIEYAPENFGLKVRLNQTK